MGEGGGWGNNNSTPFKSELRRKQVQDSVEELRKLMRKLRKQTSDLKLQASDFFTQR